MVTTMLHPCNTTVAKNGQDPDLATAERLIKTLLKYMTYEEVVSFFNEIGVPRNGG